MKVGTLKEKAGGESRVAITPQSARRIQKLGYTVVLESEAGKAAGFSDQDYLDTGVEIYHSEKELLANVDILTKVRPPMREELLLMSQSQVLISFFYPAQNQELLSLATDQKVSAIAMDMVPRISRAQKMDALSSMANIAGYRSVIEAGNNFQRFFAGQITAAGKIPPARVLVIGAGVAGLSAIGTAVSLGAIVRAFDVRAEVAEQISSMGADFLFLDFDEDQSDSGGYAKPSSPEFQKKQFELFQQVAPDTDIVICTALIPGRPAPKLWLKEMVSAMHDGSVIVDLAAEHGGNCDLTVPNKRIVTDNGVTIIGYTDFPSRMATQSSMLYATNIWHMLSDLTPTKDGIVNINLEDDVIRSTTVTHDGAVTYPPPPPKTMAIKAPKAPAAKELTTEEKANLESALLAKKTWTQVSILVTGILLLTATGFVAPVSFMQHLIVFILSCFVGFHVIWNVSHALHTPLMSITNAISGIIILGALLQIGSDVPVVTVLAAVSVLIATINIFGGFYVTKRMLAMFRKS